MLNWLLVLAQVVTPVSWAKKPVLNDLGPLKFSQEGSQVYLDLRQSFFSDQRLLPEELAHELRVFFDENSGFSRIPVVIKKNKNATQIEFIIQETILRFDPRNPNEMIYKWVDDEGGVHSQTFDTLWSERPLMFLNAVYPSEALKSRKRLFQIPELAILNKVEKKNQVLYWQNFREVLISAEHVFSGLGDTAQYRWLNALFGREAWAILKGSECVIAGWPSQKANGKCQAPAAAVQGGRVHCNPAIFGSNSGSFSRQSVPSNATLQCHQKSPVSDFVKRQNPTSREAFENQRGEFQQTIKSIQDSCLEAKRVSQQAACQALTQRVEDLEQLTCAQVVPEARTCHDLPLLAVTPQNTSSSSPLLAINSESEGGGSSHPICEPQDLLLPSSPDALSCGSENPTKSMSCRSREGQYLVRFYCECGRRFTPHYNSTDQPTRCEPRSVRSSSERSRPSSSRTPSSGNSWFKPWMGITLAAGAGLLLWYWNHKQTMNQYYSMWQPRNPVAPVPPPGLQPTAPLGVNPVAPVPVDVPRPAPTAQ